MSGAHDRAIAATADKCRGNMKLDQTAEQVASIGMYCLAEVGANKPIG